MKVLWIAGWYPNQTEPFAGDFVQRHAQAVSLFVEVTVLFIVRDAHGQVTKDVSTEEYVNGSLTERKIYYYSKLATVPVAGRIASYLQSQSLLRAEIKRYIEQNGRPDLIHFYIGMRMGSISGWIRKQNIPYVVSEQWTGFLPEGEPNFTDLPELFKKGWRSLIESATGIHVVSRYLGKALEKLSDRELAAICIPNVVNTQIFFPGKYVEADLLKLVFVTSQLGYQKNTHDILHALSLLKQKKIVFRLDIFGPVQEEYTKLSAELGVSEQVIFHGEKKQEELAAYFREADALIIYSRFETFGCVIIEANAAGTPVIASDIAVLHENIIQGKNGLFAIGEDPEKLAEELAWFAANRTSFNRRSISQHCAAVYNYETIGKAFADWYRQLLAGKKND